MRYSTTITITLPVSLHGTFLLVASLQGSTPAEACRRIVCGLSGLTDADVRSLREPPKEYGYRDIKIDLECSYLDRLSEASRVSKMTISSIFRRILHALLVTRKISFVAPNNRGEIFLGLTQKHFDFAENYESDKPIPLLSRQHRAKP